MQGKVDDGDSDPLIQMRKITVALMRTENRSQKLTFWAKFLTHFWYAVRICGCVNNIKMSFYK